MTGSELWNIFRKVAGEVALHYPGINITSPKWEDIDQWVKDSYEGVAKELSTSPLGTDDWLISLGHQKRQELYKRLHDVYSCRYY